MKRAATIGTNTLTDTARLGNVSMRSLPVNVRSRVSWIAALKQGKLFAPMTNACACNRDLFEMWLQQCLVPQLQPGDVIIIDNASFHRSQTIDQLVVAAGCEMIVSAALLARLERDRALVVCAQELDAAAMG